MKRWMIYTLAVAALLTLRPKKDIDVGTLIPVELLYISKQAGMIRAETDTGAVGTGKDLQSALEDMEETACGRIFLETADYLIVTRRTAYLLPELEKVMRPAVQVCAGVEIETDAAAYLKAHPSPVTMKDIRSGAGELPVLIYNEGRYRFGENWKLRKTA